VSRLLLSSDYAKFDVSLTLHHGPQGLTGSIEYNADLFDPATAEQLVSDFKTLHAFFITEPDRRLSDAPLSPATANRRHPRVAIAAPAPLPDSERRRPTADMEAVLLGIWRRVLDRPDVGPEDNFFDLGGNSILAVQLIGEIERRFGRELRLSTLFHEGTVRKQAGLLASGDGTPPRSLPSTLVPIQPRGSRPPFFLVHGIGGEVIGFQELADHAGSEQPIYGLQAGHWVDDQGPSTIEEIAAQYLRDLRTIAPRGPYRIGGYSAGGVIAYEMAQQLRRAGEHVALLAMLDAPAPQSLRARFTPATAWRLLKNAAYWPVDDDFFRMDRDARRARVEAKLRAMRARRHHRHGNSSGTDIRDRLGLWALPASARSYLEKYVAMMHAYRPEPYDGVVTLLRARTLSLKFRGTPDLGWRTLARSGVAVRIVPGAHDTILKKPGVSRLAAALMERLDASAE
jgi:thioesterase domain-containing protein/acyl carrier protein